MTATTKTKEFNNKLLCYQNFEAPMQSHAKATDSAIKAIQRTVLAPIASQPKVTNPNIVSAVFSPLQSQVAKTDKKWAEFFRAQQKDKAEQLFMPLLLGHTHKDSLVALDKMAAEEIRKGWTPSLTPAIFQHYVEMGYSLTLNRLLNMVDIDGKSLMMKLIDDEQYEFAEMIYFNPYLLSTLSNRILYVFHLSKDINADYQVLIQMLEKEKIEGALHQAVHTVLEMPNCADPNMDYLQAALIQKLLSLGYTADSKCVRNAVYQWKEDVNGVTPLAIALMMFDPKAYQHTPSGFETSQPIHQLLLENTTVNERLKRSIASYPDAVKALSILKTLSGWSELAKMKLEELCNN